MMNHSNQFFSEMNHRDSMMLTFLFFLVVISIEDGMVKHYGHADIDEGSAQILAVTFDEFAGRRHRSRLFNG